eukprot:GHVU01158408.1.p3 GENE.GHVU01158408.1~~GHVU01158408.1.p3  ORF type:complete len:134 (+),score=11.19 GHVU01158408.1:2650-3051(+)
MCAFVCMRSRSESLCRAHRNGEVRAEWRAGAMGEEGRQVTRWGVLETVALLRRYRARKAAKRRLDRERGQAGKGECRRDAATIPTPQGTPLHTPGVVLHQLARPTQVAGLHVLCCAALYGHTSTSWMNGGTNV